MNYPAKLTGIGTFGRITYFDFLELHIFSPFAKDVSTLFNIATLSLFLTLNFKFIFPFSGFFILIQDIFRL